ncbi:MAG: S-layer homology domain-containing protein, partial [Thermoleophilia bacterium]|nr:S-layer homology domain-containing protein [Thermoleophilia bacterium]
DLFDPTQPELVGLSHLPKRAVDVVVSGSYLYVIEPQGLIVVADVSDAAAPQQVASLDTGLHLSRVAARGNYLYLAALENGLQVVDITDPLAPALVGGVSGGSQPIGVAAAGDHLYTWSQSPGDLRVFDLTDPAAPTQVVSMQTTPWSGHDIVVQDNYAYVFGYNISVIDVSNPHAPTYVGEYPGVYRAINDLAAAGDHAYLALGADGVGLLDLAAGPPWYGGGTTQTPGAATALALSGDKLLVADYEGGLRVLSISTPGAPHEVGSTRGAPAFAHKVVVSGSLAGAASWHGSNAQFFDVSDPTRPNYLSGVLAGSFGTDVEIAGDIACGAACGTAPGVGFYDISDPSAPASLSAIPIGCYAAALRGNYAYLATNALEVWSISDLTAPVKRGASEVLNTTFDVAFQGDYAYVACGYYGLAVVDIASPSKPRLAAIVDTPYWAWSVAVSGGYAFVGDGERLAVLDISSPDSPTEVASFVPETGRIEDIALLGSYLYVADPFYGLRIIGISDPLNPVEAGGIPIPEGAGSAYATPVGTSGVSAAGNHVYVAVYGWGVLVFETHSTFADVPPDHWAADAIERCYAHGIVQGYTADAYAPTLEVNRAQMAVYVSRAIAGGDSSVPDFADSPTFPDVPEGFWALKYVEYAVDQGVVTGYEDGLYHPDEQVNRAQMAVYIARATVAPSGEAGLADYTPAHPRNFADVSPDFWAYKHVEYCVEKNVVRGYGDGLYHPEIIVTRDQMAVYIARAFKLSM